MNQLNNASFRSASVKIEPYQSYEADDIQTKLEKQLGPEYVSTRPGAGGIPVSYIEGWKAINLANQVFGFNGWCSEVKTINVDYLDDKNGKFSVGLSIVVRVTLKDGSYHEDIGYGSLDNARTKSMAFEKAKKEAMTDGLKRALRCFGNVMGNCLYDKEYLSKISGVKCAPPDFDESNLMRYTDGPSRPPTIPPPQTTSTVPSHTPAQQQRSVARFQSNPANAPPSAPVPPTVPATGAVPPPVSAPVHASMDQRRLQHQPSRATVPAKRIINIPQLSNKRRDIDDHFDDSLTFSDDLNLESEDFNDEVNELLNTKKKVSDPEDDGEQEYIESEAPSATTNAETNELHSRENETPTGENMNPPSQSIGFFKARVAEEIQKNSPTVSSAHAFNPQFISPSIRRTVDPTKSTPIKRTDVPTKSAVRYDNPRLIPNRQVGKPRVYPPPKRLADQSNKEDIESVSGGKS